MLTPHDWKRQRGLARVTRVRPSSGQARPQTSLDAHAPETATLDSDLGDALRDLSEAAAEAAASEFPVPSSAAIDNAKRLLVAMYDAAPRRFEVYPTPDGEVAIDAPTGHGSSVLLLCDSGGGVMCLVNTVGAQRLMRYGSAGEVPAAVLRDALDELEAEVN